MKHIVKRGASHNLIENNLPIGSKEVLDFNSISNKEQKNYQCYISTDKGELLKSLIFETNNKKYLIPLPDLSLVYFDSAYNLNLQRIHYEKETLVPFTNKENYGKIEFDNIYKYYGYASSCLISLFTSLECFINHLIPEKFTYHKTEKLFSKHYNQDQIQRGISFIDKIEIILPKITLKKSFFKVYNKQAEQIKKLQILRDSIVHTKTSDNHFKQEDLIRQILKFDFDKTFESVKDFINYYRPGFIEECKCGVDY
jgi:hypothetical protein